MKAGGICVATMPLLRAKELTDIITKAEVTHALCDKRLDAELKAALPQCPTLRTVRYWHDAGPDSLDERARHDRRGDAADRKQLITRLRVLDLRGEAVAERARRHASACAPHVRLHRQTQLLRRFHPLLARVPADVRKRGVARAIAEESAVDGDRLQRPLRAPARAKLAAAMARAVIERKEMRPDIDRPAAPRRCDRAAAHVANRADKNRVEPSHHIAEPHAALGRMRR